jgi:hypothetical protein
MVLRYCRQHERRWSFTRQCWIPFPQARLQAIQAYAARLRATAPEAPALTVRDTGCDVCAATPWPLAQPHGATNGRHRREP